MARMAWEITREMFLSEQETESLLALVRGEARGGATSAILDRLIVEVLLFSGVRNSEFCRLNLGDFQQKDRQPALIVRAAGGGDDLRAVHIPGEVNELIGRYIAEIRPALLRDDARANDPSEPLFLHERGRPFDRTGLYRRVVRVLSAAGLAERASVQLLRHTYGYLAYLRTGGNLLFVQRQLGHAHPMITAIYARFVDESYADLAERIATPEGQKATTVRPVPLPEPVAKKPQWTSAVEEFQSEYD